MEETTVTIDIEVLVQAAMAGNWVVLLGVLLPVLVTAATVFVALTPTTSRVGWVNTLLSLLNVLSGAVGRARNADDPGAVAIAREKGWLPKLPR